MHYLLFYDVVPDYVDRRVPLRAAHLAHAWAAADRGELVLGGALADPPDGAVLLFKCDSPGPVETFATSDPYVTNGLVARWRVREWTTVAGETAHNPIRKL
ncbi:YciI-like protein [Gemmata sp. SH-PL17]|uniref:YciI-like protein n=1 Tax=Gemmata sp. SH-PL17 TaxID=1630693 RepID=UPI000697BA99|nr:YciI-like protein [Gemmata sp. SH-PL17]AMV25566.1 YciI-like protein [Gemmata sp. SH-PL17]